MRDNRSDGTSPTLATDKHTERLRYRLISSSTCNPRGYSVPLQVPGIETTGAIMLAKSVIET